MVIPIGPFADLQIAVHQSNKPLHIHLTLRSGINLLPKFHRSFRQSRFLVLIPAVKSTSCSLNKRPKTMFSRQLLSRVNFKAQTARSNFGRWFAFHFFQSGFIFLEIFQHLYCLRTSNQSCWVKPSISVAIDHIVFCRPSQGFSVSSGRDVKVALTVTALPDIVKVYFPPLWAASLISFPWLSVTVCVSST